MEPIQHSMRKLMNKGNFKSRFNSLKDQVLSDQEIQAFLNKHKDQLSEDIINRSLNKLYEYKNQVKCDDCESLGACQNVLKGYEPRLVISGNRIDVSYDQCKKKLQADFQKKQDTLFKSMYIPQNIKSASMRDLYYEPSRLQAIQLADKFIEEYEPGSFVKGLYLFGSFGVGKTYLLAAIANKLVERGVQTLLIHTPEFLREMKSSLKDQSIGKKIDSIKQVPILMLDDIGAEAMSSWVRDDILGTILQFRMMEQLPTFFSSNLNFKELEHHFTYTQRGEVEELKAARIMERIRFLTIPIEVTGKNYRHL